LTCRQALWKQSEVDSFDEEQLRWGSWFMLFVSGLVRRSMPRSMAMRWSEIYTSLEKPQVEMPCFSWPNGLVNWLVNICLF
jgi:hypothetical protein